MKKAFVMGDNFVFFDSDNSSSFVNFESTFWVIWWLVV
jgi:hypothetical protein